ncbi:MAG: ABC transporter permease [Patescibacteria group bacterium]|nr:ABC transporter permease [Patescibacteria group bacterium]
MSLVSFWRNRWLSLAATLIMVLTLITISFFVSLLLITNRTTESLRDKVDMSVYFNDDTSKDQITAIQNILLSRSDIKSVDYVSKEKALESWRNRNKDNDKIRDLISDTDNPLPRSLEIKTKKPEDLDKINTFLGSKDYQSLIKEISYKKNKDLVDRLVKITNFLKISGWAMSLVFVLISILVIYNTIRLTIFARCDEIAIMKLVGASDLYVRGPFVFEGIGYGVLGAIVSSLIFTFTFRLTVPAAESYLGLSNLNSNYLGISLVIIIGLQFLVGLVLGIFCSVLAIKKHLK